MKSVGIPADRTTTTTTTTFDDCILDCDITPKTEVNNDCNSVFV
jgi:hypothetical protein